MYFLPLGTLELLFFSLRSKNKTFWVPLGKKKLLFYRLINSYIHRVWAFPVKFFFRIYIYIFVYYSQTNCDYWIIFPVLLLIDIISRKSLGTTWNLKKILKNLLRLTRFLKKSSFFKDKKMFKLEIYDMKLVNVCFFLQLYYLLSYLTT